MADFRVDVGFFSHIKTKRLKRALGLEGVFALQMLWAYAAQHEHDGCKVYSSDDISLAVDWDGDNLAHVLAEVGFLDEADGGYTLHEWETHNGYAASAAKRTEAARSAANKRWGARRICDGNANASDQQCDGNANAMPKDANGNAPSPSPSPSPEPSHAQDAGARVDSHPASGKTPEPEPEAPPLRTDPPLPPGQAIPEYSIEFLQLVEAYPRKEGIEDAWIAFKAAKKAHAYPGNPIALPIIVAWSGSKRWTEQGGRYVPSLKKWIEGRRWQDESPRERPPDQISPEKTAHNESMERSTKAVISKLERAAKEARPMPEHMRGRFVQGAGNDA